jgi:hypothetical protein
MMWYVLRRADQNTFFTSNMQGWRSTEVSIELDILLTSLNSGSGLRLADKRSLPCPRRARWLEARDELYEEIMQKAWNPEKKFFAQSYDEIDVLDSAVLIMPLVFFSTAVSRLRVIGTPAQVDLCIEV